MSLVLTPPSLRTLYKIPSFLDPLFYRSTWDKVDIFNTQAKRHKKHAKVGYTLLLFLTAAVTVVTVVSMNMKEHPAWTLHTDVIIMALTLLGSFIAALVAYANPETKWQQLRGASLTLER